MVTVTQCANKGREYKHPYCPYLHQNAVASSRSMWRRRPADLSCPVSGQLQQHDSCQASAPYGHPLSAQAAPPAHGAGAVYGGGAQQDDASAEGGEDQTDPGGGKEGKSRPLSPDSHLVSWLLVLRAVVHSALILTLCHGC